MNIKRWGLKTVLPFVLILIGSYDGMAQFVGTCCPGFVDPHCGYKIGTFTGRTIYSYDETATTSDEIIELNLLVLPGHAITTRYWEVSDYPTTGFQTIFGNNTNHYFLPLPLTSTKYYREVLYFDNAASSSAVSNVLKIEIVSKNQKGENKNYVREYNVQIPGITDWKTIADGLPGGNKTETTTYYDGLGRPIQKINKEVATPQASTPGVWGDVVEYHKYDEFGRQPKAYLPYSTTTQTGKYKTNPDVEQSQYYANPATYNETNPYTNNTYNNDPLNRVKQTNAPGYSWDESRSTGTQLLYDLNETNDDVQNFSSLELNDDPATPRNVGAYPVNTLFKTKKTDEAGNKVIEFINKSGQLTLICL